MEFGLFKDRKIVFSIQMLKENILDWIDLKPIKKIEIEKDNNNDSLSISVCDIICDAKLFEYKTTEIGNWLCKDDRNDWHIIDNASYQKLDTDKKVFSPLNDETRRQVLTIMAINKLKSEFNNMSYEEQLEFAEKYPEFVIKRRDYTAKTI